MALLRNEDQEYVTSLELKAGARQTIETQVWQQFTLALTSGARRIELGGENANAAEIEACILCREPKDEVNDLIGRLKLLADSVSQTVLFEPAEPSFELRMSRSGATGIKVEVWLDEGNATTGIYRWDGVGIRFFTLQKHLLSFIKELETEFAI